MVDILIVEDESIVAQDIQRRLTNLGYGISALVSTGKEAIQEVGETSPDLVLMDIVLKGEMDGIQAAETIRSQFSTPVVYLTAYADEKTLKRAQITEPFGYIVKPFEDRELHATIKMALYKYQIEKKVRESEQWLFTTLKSIGNAVIATDTQGQITFMNPVAEELTGWTQKEALEKPLSSIVAMVSEELNEPVGNPVDKVLQEDVVVGLATHILIAKNGRKIAISDSAAPIKDETETTIGVVLVFRDITELKQTEETLKWELTVNAALYKVYKPLISPSSSLEDIASTILDQARSLTGSIHGYVSSIDPHTGANIGHTLTEMLKDQCTVSEKEKRIVFSPEKSGKYPGLWGYSLTTGEPFFTNTPEKHPASKGTPPGHIPVQRFLSVPVMLGEELVGQIALANKEYEYTKRDLDAILRLADIYALAIQRKRVEEALRESEEKFRGITERNFDAIYELDSEGRITYVSPAVERITGHTPEEIVGDPLQKYTSKLSMQVVCETLDKTLEGESVEGLHIETVKKDGTIAILELNMSPIIKEERIVGCQGVARDISQRKRAEMQLQSLFEASKLINSTMEMDRIYEFVSDSVQHLVGFDHFVIFLISESEDADTLDREIYPAYASSEIRDSIEELTVGYGEGLIGSCIQTKKSVLINRTEPTKKGTGIEMGSQIAVPLIIENHCVGALHISRSAPHAYGQEDIDVLKPLSEVISFAIRNSRLHNEIKEFSQKLEKRIKERSERIENLLNTRQNLQSEVNWEEGLNTIVESMSKLGFDRVGIFLVDLMSKKLNFHVGRGTDLPKEGASLSLRETEYFGVRCVLEKRTIHVTDPHAAEGKQMVDSTSFVWVPIIVQNEAFAALAASSIKEKRITAEDVNDLEILASMCAAFIDRTRILVEPIAEKKLKTKLKYWLEPAECCIITEKKPEKSFEIFVDLVTHGISGFVVSREYPEKVKRKYKLQKTPMLWLSRTERENTIGPDDLSKLYYIIDEFTRKTKESVILLDGLEYLITQANFDTVLKHLLEFKDTIILYNSRLIIPVHVETLSPREYSILEREFTIMGAG
ncbi:MAG: hypothetical protein AYK18_10460 [Theionarchaea archaeon DG-70]|nr:MAG: hypothetical protein AYK18_10460 [Theionarchaea archaeon DG-70]